MANQFSVATVSLLDTDLYKLTMHAAVFTNFPQAQVKYKYKNRTPAKDLSPEAVKWLKFQVSQLGSLRFSSEEIEYLRLAVSYLPSAYFDYLKDFQLKPHEQVTIATDPHLDISIQEAYFKFVDTDWDLHGQQELATSKIAKLFEHGIPFSEFGTRRRRSFETQDIVVKALNDYKNLQPVEKHKLLIGTSNVLLAKKYNLRPVGTVAHEWIMGVAASSQDYVNANKLAMDYWINTVGSKYAGLALTDTFGTDAFLKAFYPPYSDDYVGFRQDSGDPLVYTDKIAKHLFEVLKLPKFSKSICYSDSLNIDKCIKYFDYAQLKGVLSSFGIGTNFTNDFKSNVAPYEVSHPLNIVIKLSELDGKPAIKISDNLGKNMGDPETVARVKKLLGYTEAEWSEGDESKRW